MRLISARSGALGGLVILTALNPLAAAPEQVANPAVPGTLGAREVAEQLAEAPAVVELALAPDGHAVVYTVTRGSVAANENVMELRLQLLDPHGAPQGSPRKLDQRRSPLMRSGSFAPRFSPDGRSLAFFATLEAQGSALPSTSSSRLVRYDVATAQPTPIEVHDPSPPPGARARPTITSIPANYQWSPTGKYLAFTASIGRDPGLDPRAGVLATLRQGSEPGIGGDRRGLFVLDLATGRLTQTATSAVHVVSFDWSPDERAFVLAVSPDGLGATVHHTDLVILDRLQGTVRPLVTQPGADYAPRWSPDGAWIAFSSHFGRLAYTSGGPAVVAASGGAVVRLSDSEGPSVARILGWQPDSRAFLYSSEYHLRKQPIRATLASKTSVPLLPEALTSYASTELSADGRWLAFTRESPTSPPELCLQTYPHGQERTLTQVGAAFKLGARVQVEAVSWPSRDARFTIHGLLLTPRDVWQGEGASRRVKAPLPTLVFHMGGPLMVDAGFAAEGLNGALLALASRGYAVLVPNTRGRTGYGEAFRRGIADGRSAVRLPSEDATAGVDRLVQIGLADPERLGVLGHSYGGSLTMFVISQTTRYRAALNHEGGNGDYLTPAITRTAPESDDALMLREFGGLDVTDPFDPAEQARIMADSAIFNLRRVRTPTLLHFGAKSLAARYGAPLYAGLQRAGVPSEFRVYDEAHTFHRPAAVADDLARVAEWFDYWVRGFPHPDTTRAAHTSSTGIQR